MNDIKGKNIRVHIQTTSSVVTEYVYQIDGTDLSKRMESSDEDECQEARSIKRTLDSLAKGDNLSESEMIRLNDFCLNNAKMIDHYHSSEDNVEILDSYLDDDDIMDSYLDYYHSSEDDDDIMDSYLYMGRIM